MLENFQLCEHHAGANHAAAHNSRVQKEMAGKTRMVVMHGRHASEYLRMIYNNS
jgi:hypothetical protein